MKIITLFCFDGSRSPGVEPAASVQLLLQLESRTSCLVCGCRLSPKLTEGAC